MGLDSIIFLCTRCPPKMPRTHRPRAAFPPHPPHLIFSFAVAKLPTMSMNPVPTSPPTTDQKNNSMMFPPCHHFPRNMLILLTRHACLWSFSITTSVTLRLRTTLRPRVPQTALRPQVPSTRKPPPALPPCRWRRRWPQRSPVGWHRPGGRIEHEQRCSLHKGR